MDQEILTWVGEARSDGLVDLAKIVTRLGDPLVLCVIAVAGAAGLIWAGRRQVGFAFTAGMLLASGLSFALKWIVDRPRPTAHFADGVIETSGSFPSGHAFLTTAAFVGLAFVISDARSSWMMGVLIALLVGLSRIVLGVHYPTDVLAGWGLGALVVVGMVQVAKRETA